MKTIIKCITEVIKGFFFFAIMLLAILFIGNVVFAGTSEVMDKAIVVETVPYELSPYREIIMNATEEELMEFEQVLYLEAHTDTWEGRVATAQVVLNRVLDPRFKNSIHEVLSTTGPVQYPTYWRRETAKPGEAESDAICFLCNCESWELVIDQQRVYQDMNPIGKNPIKVGKQYFGY